MFNLIDKIEELDEDLIVKIYTYILYPQPSCLLEDIRSFNKTKNRLQHIYNERYAHEPDEINNWIYNDLMLFYNNDNPIMNGFTYGYIEKINRGFIKYTPSNIVKYIQYCDNKKDVKSLINIYISRLTIKERYELVSMTSSLSV